MEGTVPLRKTGWHGGGGRREVVFCVTSYGPSGSSLPFRDALSPLTLGCSRPAGPASGPMALGPQSDVAIRLCGCCVVFLSWKDPRPTAQGCSRNGEAASSPHVAAPVSAAESWLCHEVGVGVGVEGAGLAFQAGWAPVPTALGACSCLLTSRWGLSKSLSRETRGRAPPGHS